MKAGNDDGAAPNKVAAMRALIAWADSKETVAALEAIELLSLTDADIEALFRRHFQVVRIPHLGRVR
jgi:hypothetical protein